MKKIILLSFAMLSIFSFSFAQEGKVIELGLDNFTKTVGDYNNISTDGFKYIGKEPMILDFTASWCPPCRKIEPILKELAKEYAGKIKIYKVDVDKARAISVGFGVTAMPTLFFIPTEGESKKIVGARTKAEFVKYIETVLLKK